MTGFLHYFLNSIDPRSAVGLFNALPRLLASAYLPFWIFGILPLVRFVFPGVGCWLVYAVRPAVIRPPLPADPPRSGPLVSVVIAGRNESASIGGAIRAAMLCGYTNLELIFVDDGSDDDSVVVARRAARSLGLHESGRIRIFESPRRNGKASALNIGLSVARGEFIAVLDADSTIQYGAMQHWLLPFADPKVGAVAGNIRVRNNGETFLTRMQELEYALQATLGRLATARIGLLYIVPGAGGLFRADVMRRLGGYDTGLGDDTDMTMKLRKQRWKLGFSVDAVVWTDVPTTMRGLFRQRARWERNMVKIRLSKHRDMFLIGRYGFGNAILTLDLLFVRLALPWLVLCGVVYVTFVSGPLTAPLILTDSYWLYLCWLTLKALIARDIARTPTPDRFWLVFLYPFYKLVFRLVVMGASTKELFRIGIKHPYVPDHVWMETPWW
jgi:cellulose synthase/poly-beta-1,6-N-acetylglucosamine synthase-like glycosyltransferase